MERVRLSWVPNQPWALGEARSFLQFKHLLPAPEVIFLLQAEKTVVLREVILGSQPHGREEVLPSCG